MQIIRSKMEGPAAVRVFALRLGLVMLLLVSASVLGIYLRTKSLVEQGAREQAASYLDLVLVAREWNAVHGGVWVEKTADVRTNVFLTELGAQPDTVTAGGTTLTLRNPAVMTRELSDLTSRNSDVSFRLTSLEPVNPDNSPDAWEAEQLRTFRAGSSDAVTIERPAGERVLRSIRPLWAKPECLECHAAKGTKAGDMRGAISVSVSMAARDAALNKSALALGLLWLGLVSGGGFVLYALVYRLADQLEASESRLRYLATTDPLTGLPNRRATLDRLHEEMARASREDHGLGIILVDIDHFKSINDACGHAGGDRVLIEVAERMRTAVRTYDLLGRVGGEEFLVVAPAPDSDALAALAERVRAAVERDPVKVDASQSVEATISAGCALAVLGGEDEDELMRRADAALYEAKRTGRNTVRTG